MAIDYTGFQFHLCNDDREAFKNYTIAQERMENILLGNQIIYNIDEYDLRKLDFKVREIDCFALSTAKCVTTNPWNLESFMGYLRNACNSLNDNRIIMTYALHE